MVLAAMRLQLESMGMVEWAATVATLARQAMAATVEQAVPSSRTVVQAAMAAIPAWLAPAAWAVW